MNTEAIQIHSAPPELADLYLLSLDTLDNLSTYQLGRMEISEPFVDVEYVEEIQIVSAPPEEQHDHLEQLQIHTVKPSSVSWYTLEDWFSLTANQWSTMTAYPAVEGTSHIEDQQAFAERT